MKGAHLKASLVSFFSTRRAFFPALASPFRIFLSSLSSPRARAMPRFPPPVSPSSPSSPSPSVFSSAIPTMGPRPIPEGAARP